MPEDEVSEDLHRQAQQYLRSAITDEVVDKLAAAGLVEVRRNERGRVSAIRGTDDTVPALLMLLSMTGRAYEQDESMVEAGFAERFGRNVGELSTIIAMQAIATGGGDARGGGSQESSDDMVQGSGGSGPGGAPGDG